MNDSNENINNLIKELAEFNSLQINIEMRFLIEYQGFLLADMIDINNFSLLNKAPKNPKMNYIATIYSNNIIFKGKYNE